MADTEKVHTLTIQLQMEHTVPVPQEFLEDVHVAMLKFQEVLETVGYTRAALYIDGILMEPKC